MGQKRILFLTTSTGSGHMRASEAMEEAICRTSHETFDIQTETCFDYLSPSSRKITTKTYIKSIQLIRRVLKSLYNYRKKHTDKDSAEHFLSIPLMKKRKKVIRNFDPDIIVCTHALSCRFVSILKSKREISASLIAVITDFDVHPYWFSKYVDAFIVPTDEIKKEFISHRIKMDKIHAFGIPIHPAFSKTQNKLVLKTQLGMRKNIPIILIIGGGWGLGPIKKIVKRLNSSKMALQLIVITGKNEVLQKKLKKISPRLNVSIKIFGYVNNIDEFMEVSDIAITKPGGLAVSELLAKGLPAILIDVISGQERTNGDYLISKGAACRIKKTNQLKDTIRTLLSDPLRLDQMRANAKAAAKPFAARDTARLIMTKTN
ncbi:glycosyltransferase [bacterium]|nr:glycosyltransferase [bacterium]